MTTLESHQWGEVLNRSALVASVQNSTAKYSSFFATDVHVRIYGPTAVVNMHLERPWRPKRSQFRAAVSRLHVYLNNSLGGWKVVAGQETILPG